MTISSFKKNNFEEKYNSMRHSIVDDESLTAAESRNRSVSAVINFSKPSKVRP